MQHGVCVNTEPHGNIFCLTTSVLIFFEYLITLDQEVKLFWRNKLTGAVALFFANRYITITYTMYFMLTNMIPATSANAQVSLSPVLL